MRAFFLPKLKVEIVHKANSRSLKRGCFVLEAARHGQVVLLLFRDERGKEHHITAIGLQL